jgi:hypothetical protein
VIDNTPEPNKSQIIRIKDQIPECASKAMAESKNTREAIVATLRMTVVYRFMQEGKAYFQSAEFHRSQELLDRYGPEFPEEIEPDKYLEIARRYKQENFGPE